MTYSVYTGGAEESVDLTVWDGAAEATPSRSGIVPFGYSSYSDMLSQDVFYVAHRGGSGDWPVNSLQSWFK